MRLAELFAELPAPIRRRGDYEATRLADGAEIVAERHAEGFGWRLRVRTPILIDRLYVSGEITSREHAAGLIFRGLWKRALFATADRDPGADAARTRLYESFRGARLVREKHEGRRRRQVAAPLTFSDRAQAVIDAAALDVPVRLTLLHAGLRALADHWRIPD